MFDALIARGFQVEIHSHARAILSVDFPDAVAELEDAIGCLSIPIEEIVGSGGGESQGTQRLRRALAELGWTKMNFIVEKRINGVAREAISHEIDHVKAFEAGVVACEIEWNNKDPFFDRDLENFKRLHADGAISVGVIVTRGSSMQDELKAMVQRFAAERRLNSHAAVTAFGMSRTARQNREVERRIRAGQSYEEAWAGQFVSDKYGMATTHWSKLEDRVHRGVGNPCPLVLVGLPSSIVTFDEGLQLIDIEDEADALIEEGIASAEE
ncbi:hypothetical protein GCM10007276_26650 [Agaricicola taiwanensis]|uniref:Restriction endonuclease n=1 Tax=Agaricicola taiwanensis TaxID=591372 RepID=A0A8J2YJJ1_9RHOB|nr:BglII/BstYI family type II restriction endonuclease [Agaricicola taiwanensis]GGE48082.1 hypothetical protein GCM10007276_26650 [Agaricicola taiwanensis]